MACTQPEGTAAPTAGDAILTLREAASWLRCSERTAYQWIADGAPHLRTGGGRNASVRFRRSELESWLRGRSRARSGATSTGATTATAAN